MSVEALCTGCLADLLDLAWPSEREETRASWEQSLGARALVLSFGDSRAWRVEKPEEAAGKLVFSRPWTQTSRLRRLTWIAGVDVDTGEAVRIELASDLDTGRLSLAARYLGESGEETVRIEHPGERKLLAAFETDSSFGEA